MKNLQLNPNDTLLTKFEIFVCESQITSFPRLKMPKKSIVVADKRKGTKNQLANYQAPEETIAVSSGTLQTFTNGKVGKIQPYAIKHLLLGSHSNVGKEYRFILGLLP